MHLACTYILEVTSRKDCLSCMYCTYREAPMAKDSDRPMYVPPSAPASSLTPTALTTRCALSFRQCKDRWRTSKATCYVLVLETINKQGYHTCPFCTLHYLINISVRHFDVISLETAHLVLEEIGQPDVIQNWYISVEGKTFPVGGGEKWVQANLEQLCTICTSLMLSS